MDEDELYRELGKNLANRRRAISLTQAAVSEKIGISRASLANIERGNQKVLLHHVYSLASALGLTDVRELLPITKSGVPQGDAASAAKISSPDSLTLEQRRQIEAMIAIPQPARRKRSA